MYNKYNLKEIVKKWSNMPGNMSIANIPDRNIRESMAIVLENQDQKNLQRELFSEASLATTTVGSSTINDTTAGAFAPMTIALMRRSFPALFAHAVIPTQPMSGPVGLAYALRVLYNTTAYPKVEAAFNDVNAYSGFSGSISSTSGTNDAGRGVATATAEGWNIGTDMPELTVRIDQTAITATTRKLAASFSLETIQDLEAMHSIDVQRMILNHIQYEMQAEIDREVVSRLLALAVDIANGGEAVTTYDVSAADGRWSQEKFSNIINQIIKKSNDIAVSTRRGAGNFVIVSTRLATALQSAGPQFNRNQSVVEPGVGFPEIGTINGKIKVYHDTFAATDYALVGYKGPGVEDGGLIYSPYITGLVSTGMAQEDFSKRIGVMNRAAFTSSLLGSGRYYRRINFTNLDTLIS